MEKKDGPKFKIENNILKSIKMISCEIKNRSLGEFVLNTLEDSANFVGQVDAVTGEEYTYEEMRERSVRCALWMRSQGLLPGDVVAICSHNQLDVAMPCLAALYLGAVFNPLNTKMNTRDFLHLINITRPKMAFVSEDSATVLAEAMKEVKLDVKIIVFGRVTGFLEFESVIAEPEVDDVKNFECTPIKDPRQTAMILSSSGTSGLPKCVVLSHETIIEQLLQSEEIGMAGNKCLMFSTLYWISGALWIFMELFWKVTKIITPAFDEYSAWEIVEKFQISWIFLGSSMINRLLKSDALARYDLSRVTRVCYGGAPLALTSREAFAKFVPNALITSAYGLTEVCGIITMQTAISKPRSSGQFIGNSQLKVIDPDTGRTLGTNQIGELLFKTTSMMSCYYGDPQATAETLDEEGWLRSGDIGYYDENGEIYVLERSKELIKCRGYKVSPFELETVIWSHPGVKEVAVVGSPHPEDGEHPVAFVVRATDSTGAGKNVTEMELVDLVAAELSDSKRLRGGVRFVDHLPTTPSGKAIRRELRELAKSMARSGGDRRIDSLCGPNSCVERKLIISMN